MIVVTLILHRGPVLADVEVTVVASVRRRLLLVFTLRAPVVLLVCLIVWTTLARTRL